MTMTEPASAEALPFLRFYADYTHAIMAGHKRETYQRGTKNLCTICISTGR